MNLNDYVYHEWPGHGVLYCGDCLKILPLLEAGSVDAVVTDPPYGVEECYPTFTDSFDQWMPLFSKSLVEFRRIARHGIFMSTSKFEAETYVFNCLRPLWRIVWYKGAADTRSPIGWKDWESVFIFNRPSRMMHDYFYACAANVRDEFPEHPCPKPIRWAEHLVEMGTDSGDSVIDGFAGIGTTAVACIRTGRNFIGIELEPKYCAIAKARIDRELQQPRLPFVEPVKEVQTEMFA